MKQITSEALREKYLKFFESKGHKIIPSASLIPENDPTVLFTTAGMHPLVPYLLGEKHPEGKRLTDVQKCVRTGDIDEVGDLSHCTFFEMLGCWSLGDYFKDEMIPWSYEFLTSEEYLGIPSDQLAITCFEGDQDAPKDEKSAEIWVKCGIKPENVYFLPKKDNWWGPAGLTGPCGPDSEMFIIRKEKCGPDCSPSCSCGAFLEIWNDVFMEYNKVGEGKFEPLAQKNVDTGMGLERTLCILNGQESVYDTDVFEDAIAVIEKLTGKGFKDDEETTRAFRIILDHTRTATFMIGDRKGITPSNVDQGYVLRRIIRRAVRYGRNINLPKECLAEIAEAFVNKYKDAYPELVENEAKIKEELTKEERKFQNTLQKGLKEFEKAAKKVEDGVIDGITVFHLYDTYGFPYEITEELATEKGLKLDKEGYEKAFSEHQNKSKAGAEGKFKAGLADNAQETVKLHTATHLLQAALQKVLQNDNIQQKGSNITAERLRFDFSFPRPVTKEEQKQVEDLVNEVIKQDLPVVMEEMTLEEAKERGFFGVFESKYGERVKTYSIGDFSREICGGPHATHTAELGTFKIKKEQSSSSGVRRIKAVLIPNE